MFPNILSGKLLKVSTMDDKEKGLYMFSQAAMVASGANMIVAYTSGSVKLIVRYHSVTFTIDWFFFAPLITL